MATLRGEKRFFRVDPSRTSGEDAKRNPERKFEAKFGEICEMAGLFEVQKETVRIRGSVDGCK